MTILLSLLAKTKDTKFSKDPYFPTFQISNLLKVLLPFFMSEIVDRI